MGTLIITRENERFNCCSDQDFYDLLLAKIGPDAARYYEDRLKPYSRIREDITNKFTNLASESQFLKDLYQMSDYDVWTLMNDLSDLRGWNE